MVSVAEVVSLAEDNRGWLVDLLAPHVVDCSSFAVEQDYWGEWGELGVVPEDVGSGIFEMLGQPSRVLSVLYTGDYGRLDLDDLQYLVTLIDESLTVEE